LAVLRGSVPDADKDSGLLAIGKELTALEKKIRALEQRVAEVA
jgi:hypothetical protein